MINILNSTGLELNVQNSRKVVYGDLVFCTADTPAGQFLTGTKITHFAHKPCRNCDTDRVSMKNFFRKSFFTRRDVTVHNERCDFLGSDMMKETKRYWSRVWGINSRTPLLDITAFDPFKCVVQDMMHTLLEGIVPNLLACFMYNAIFVNKSFTLDTFNKHLINFAFHDIDKRNKPEPFDRKGILIQGIVRQTAACTLQICYTIPFILSKLLKEVDVAHYRHLIYLFQIVQLCTAPYADANTAGELEILVEEFGESLKTLYPTMSIKPKMHFLVHAVGQLINFGPARGTWAMRFEANHQVIKAFRFRNFKNLPLSVGEKYQRHQAARMMSNNLIDSNADYFGTQNWVGECELVDKEGTDWGFLRTELCILLGRNNLTDTLVYRCKKVNCNSHTYTPGLAMLLDWEENWPSFGIIKDILLIEGRHIVILDRVDTVMFEWRVNAYMVRMVNNVTLRDLDAFSNNWPLPVYKQFDETFITNRYAHFAQGLF